jgi:hypothetical protein
MHKSSSIIETIWRKRNWWSIGEISRRRWSISSCRHIFALRQKVKKNHNIFFSSWYVLHCQCYSLYVYVLQSFGWYGVVVWRYHYDHHHHIPFFPSLLLFSTSSLRFFFVHRQHYCCEATTHDERIYIHMCIKNVCSFLCNCTLFTDSRYIFIRGNNVVMRTIE